MRKSKLRDKILEYKAKGMTHKKVCELLNCSKSVIIYHLTSYDYRKKRNRKEYLKYGKKHPYNQKLHDFKLNKILLGRSMFNGLCSNNAIMSAKITRFFKDYKTKMIQEKTFGLNDVINKFGNNPKCYLTGDDLDINNGRSFNFDHIIPRSRGGLNTLDNLGLCTKKANEAKGDQTPDELFNLCKKILENNGYRVEKM